MGGIHEAALGLGNQLGNGGARLPSVFAVFKRCWERPPVFKPAKAASGLTVSAALLKKCV